MLTDEEIDDLFIKAGGSWGVSLQGPSQQVFGRAVEAAVLARLIPVAWISRPEAASLLRDGWCVVVHESGCDHSSDHSADIPLYTKP
jgi:hypothetical protein